MVDLLEIAERSQTGPKMSPKEWDLNYFKKITAYVNDYGIKYDNKEFFNTNEKILDHIIEGAIDFVSAIGVYCFTTNRVINFSKKEVESAIKASPEYLQVGQGNDARIVKKRKIEEDESLGLRPGHHSPYTSDIISSAVRNFAQIPRADFLEGPNFMEINGR